VIELLREEPKLKPFFLNLVQTTLADRCPSGTGDGQVPRELIELAAHELRWPEFVALASERLTGMFGGNWRLAASDPARSIPEALSDDWGGPRVLPAICG
jgi:hypothetical protein